MHTYWSIQSPFKCALCEYCTVPKDAVMNSLNICEEKID